MKITYPTPVVKVEINNRVYKIDNNGSISTGFTENGYEYYLVYSTKQIKPDLPYFEVSAFIEIKSVFNFNTQNTDEVISMYGDVLEINRLAKYYNVNILTV